MPRRKTPRPPQPPNVVNLEGVRRRRKLDEANTLHVDLSSAMEVTFLLSQVFDQLGFPPSYRRPVVEALVIDLLNDAQVPSWLPAAAPPPDEKK